VSRSYVEIDKGSAASVLIGRVANGSVGISHSCSNPKLQKRPR
jgi:hypothetical protein